MIRILLADDQALVRTGFRMILDNADDMQVVGEAADGAQAAELALELQPDIVLMDVRMPEVDGVEATRRICAGTDRIRVLILTTFDLDEYVYAALHAGASGFLLKDTLAPDLLSAIRVVARGDAVVAPSVTRRLLERYVGIGVAQPVPAAGLDALTEREREVLSLIARGLSNTEIAGILFLSEGTVKTHVSRVLAKLGLRDRVQAVVFAYESGLVRTGAT
ncbi:response regulator [Nonomuraea gerenzanensis]|uniref:DNA-binding response regulator, LuxR family n=1 Tax=Nonomuraea gerenzanensis TaxID=93944 RepID=A0A1M4ECZ4_9ACTN|nr:response regulator transcription factor [Nonomuraea gerenzanensis]UBU08343.1 response regulator transcription factor [Nonomuraea gerenzanensis]SBO96680.1 DNA-binding response regulator, LuxR family [Nonomuraea gerenzanensis]